MDPIAVDAPKVTSTFLKPGAPAKPEPGAPAKPPFPSAAPNKEESAKLTAKIAEMLGLRKNLKIVGAAACSLLIGYGAVKYFAPKPHTAETKHPLVAEAKKEEPKPEETPKPSAPGVTESRVPELPTVPPGFVTTTTPSTPVAPPIPPTLPPSAIVLPPTLPPTSPEVPATSKHVLLPTVPEVVLPPTSPVIPAGGVESPKVPSTPSPVLPATPAVPPSVPSVPPSVPMVPETPAVPGISPPAAVVPPSVPAALPMLPATPPTSPTTPSVPATPPLVPPSVPATPPLVPPTTPTTPPVPPTVPMTPSVPASPPAFPAVEPSRPLSIEYTKPASTTSPDRAATTTFDVDLHEPTKTDTYTTISRSYYNDEKFAAALSEYNGRRALQGGVRVEVPPIHVLKKRYPTLIGAVVPASGNQSAKDPWQPAVESVAKSAPGRTFTVPTGGLRMAEIARMTLGSPTKWSEIYDLNPSLSPSDLLPAGTIVKIPESK